MHSTTPISIPEITANSIDITSTPSSPTVNTRLHQNDERIQTKPNPVTSSVINFGERLQPTTSKPTPFTPSVSSTSNENLVPVLTDANKVPEPATVLLPPFENLNLYSGATTQGPPIYFEWKIPASGLEPPIYENKSNGVITITDGNQVPVLPPQNTIDAVQQSITIPPLEKDLVPPLLGDNNSVSDESNEFANIKPPSVSLRPPLFSPPSQAVASSNHSFPSIAPISQHSSVTIQNKAFDKSQTPRSVTTTGRTINGITTKRQSIGDAVTPKDINYLDLKKQLLIPEFTFPLETVQRPSYTESNAVNSFQIRIPDDVAQNRADLTSSEKVKSWFGENSECPECHPSFLKPGSCEPCIKFR